MWRVTRRRWGAGKLDRRRGKRDREGDVVRSLCKEFCIDAQGIVTDHERPTTVKNRIVVGHHQVLRVDQESKASVSRAIEYKMLSALKAAPADVVIFSDYAKGAVSKNTVAAAVKKFGRERILADFKPSKADCYRGIGYIFPNIKEAGDLTGIEAVTKPLAKQVALELAKRFGASVVLKRSEYGMTLYSKTEKNIMHIPTQAREVFDVTGAGDTVIAVAGVALRAGLLFVSAMKIANHAAGIVVEMEGTAAPDLAVLIERCGL